MTFIAMAMMYYGLILFNLRKITKKIRTVEGKKSNEDAEELSNKIIKFDRLILIIYMIIFILFNVYYFIKYLRK